MLPYKTVRNISIHAPRVGSDRQGADQTQTETISIHAPRVGSDTADESSLAIAAISIHAPRVGSDSRRPGIGLLACISIHAPRVGSDGHHGYGGGLHLYFNPRSPCGERRVPFLLGQAEARDFNPRSPCGERRTPRLWRWITSIFQSTLPVWGATQLCRAAAAAQGDFNPRSPCGERPLFDEKIIQRGIEDFNPRSPCGERPPFGFLFPALVNFNPRSPCGERRSTSNVDTSPRTFQSTLPVWGATAEGRRGTIVATNFNPRSPCGERPERTGRGPSKSAISIHAPRVGSDPAAFISFTAR